MVKTRTRIEMNNFGRSWKVNNSRKILKWIFTLKFSYYIYILSTNLYSLYFQLARSFSNFQKFIRRIPPNPPHQLCISRILNSHLIQTESTSFRSNSSHATARSPNYDNHSIIPLYSSKKEKRNSSYSWKNRKEEKLEASVWYIDYRSRSAD